MSNPYASAEQPTAPTPVNQANLSYDAIRPLYFAQGWMKLCGWSMIIVGVIYCLTIIGIIVAWLPIWMGFLLKNAAEKLKLGYEQQNPVAVTESNRNLGTLATIFGVLTIINLVILGIYIVMFVGLMLVGGLSAAMQ